jgi:uncharacterized DUF497 family protein
MYNKHTELEFDPRKEASNLAKHGIDFSSVREIFEDPDVVHLQDVRHSGKEGRLYAVGKVSSGRVITVWYTWRGDRVRIIGAAEIRKWRKEYEKRKIAGSEKIETS